MVKQPFLLGDIAIGFSRIVTMTSHTLYNIISPTSREHQRPGKQPMTEPQQITLPVYVLIGTKAQYIKVAPLLRLMQAREMDYVLIDTGQHAEFNRQLRRDLEIREPDVLLADGGNIKTIGAAMSWFARQIVMIFSGRRHLKQRVFFKGQGVCVIHGDTLSTLLGLILAKRTGQKVAHIESGLRSYNYFKPFPEEIIRIICMHWSDVLFAPSDWARDNLHKMGARGEVVNTTQNTSIEALYFSLKKAPAREPLPQDYVLMAIHRVETIHNRWRLQRILQLTRKITAQHPIIFVLHDHTAVKLKQYGLMRGLEKNPMIRTTSLLSHSRMLRLIEQACFVLTDGGSVQEECFYLDVPCLLLRSETERQEGIGGNVALSGFDDNKIRGFLDSYQGLRRGSRARGHETL